MSIAIPKALQAMYCVCDFFNLEKGNISHEIGFLAPQGALVVVTV